jgi:hypothetical protein
MRGISRKGDRLLFDRKLDALGRQELKKVACPLFSLCLIGTKVAGQRTAIKKFPLLPR